MQLRVRGWSCIAVPLALISSDLVWLQSSVHEGPAASLLCRIQLDTNTAKLGKVAADRHLDPKDLLPYQIRQQRPNGKDTWERYAILSTRVPVVQFTGQELVGTFSAGKLKYSQPRRTPERQVRG